MPDPAENETDAGAGQNDATAGKQPAPPPPAPPAPAPAAAATQAAQVAKPMRAVVLVGNQKLPGDDRFVVVTESRTFDEAGVATLNVADYPAGADLYYRTDPAVTFPPGSKVITLGEDVQQGYFWGMMVNPTFVCVGPASPAYGAANLAFQQGAVEIDIVGLSDVEKVKLQPFVDAIPTDKIAPAAVTVSLL